MQSQHNHKLGLHMRGNQRRVHMRSMRQGIEMLGLINAPTRAGLMADLEARLADEQGFTLATMNLDHLVKLRADATFRAVYAHHSHVVADGLPVAWLRQLAGSPVELVPGSDLVGPLMALAARLGVPVAFVGATEATLATAAARLEAAHAGLRVVARIAPPFGFDPEGPEGAAVIDALAASGARLCILALGAPRQESLAVRAAEILPGCGFASLGAGLDFIAGRQRRAPASVRRLGMEWFWRLLTDPRRLTLRYARCALLLPELAWQAVYLRDTGRRH